MPLETRSCFFQSFQFAMFNFGDHGFNITSLSPIVCYTAVFSVITQRSSPLSGEERCKPSKHRKFCNAGLLIVMSCTHILWLFFAVHTLTETWFCLNPDWS